MNFATQVDSVDAWSGKVVVGLSSLEGNIWDGGVKILSSDTGLELASLSMPCGVTRTRFSGALKGTVLVSRDDGVISLHAAGNLKQLQVFDGHDDCAIAFSEDTSSEGKFYSAGWDSSILGWDWRGRTPKTSTLRIRNAHAGHIADVALQSASQLLASTGADGILRVWDLRDAGSSSGRAAQVLSLGQVGSSLLWDEVHLPHGLLVGTDGGDVQYWDLRGGYPQDSLATMSRAGSQFAHLGRVRRIVSAGSSLLTASDDCTVASLDVHFNSEDDAVTHLIEKHR